MAGNRIDMDLSVQDRSNTIKDRTNDAKKLNEQLERAQNLMRSTGTQTGNQAMRRAGYAGQVEDYNIAHGVAGAGGASARDFADQSRGLGPLVRLYANWAANVFAVSAAFNALREAMSTDMLLRGLDQLGAQSGVALGGLAKQFAAVTDGAVSLRLASEMTAKAMSSGMSPEQFIELGKVAKGASQALGINMDDAVSRLTRGIVKLEPELLDELGIFTKLDKAVTDYARQIGKSENQLSDFERRQAFANAVLKEGKDKFGAIAQEGNPYDQLLASLKNVAQDLLSIVNTVIGPIARFLANNTELLGVAIAGAVIKITNQAIPALVNWQIEMKNAAKVAAQRANEISEVFAKSDWDRAVAKTVVPEIRKQLNAAEKELRAEQLRLLDMGKSDVKNRQWFKELTTQEELSGRAQLNVNKQITKEVDKQTDSQKAFNAQLSSVVEKQKIVAKLRQDEARELAKLQESGQFETTGLRDIAQTAKNVKAAKLDLLSNVYDLVYSKGFTGGLGEFYKEVDARKDFDRLDRLATKLKGTFLGIAAQIGLAFQAASKYLIYVEIAVAAFYALDAVFSTNKKQVKALDDAISSMEETTKTASMTAEKFIGILNAESIVAVSNNFNGMTSSVKATAKAFGEFEKYSSTFNKIKEFYSGSPLNAGTMGGAVGAAIGSAFGGIGAVPGSVVGLGVGTLLGGIVGAVTEKEQNKVAEEISDLLTQAIQSAPEGDIRNSLEEKLGAALGTTTLNKKSIKDIVQSSDDLTSLLKNIGKVLEQTDKILEQSKILTKNIEETTKKQVQSYQTLANSVSDQSPLTTFLMDTLKRTQALTAGFGDVRAAVAALDSLAQTGPTFAAMTTEQANNLNQIIAQYKVLREEESDLRKSIKDRNEEFEKTNKKTVDQLKKDLDKLGIEEGSSVYQATLSKSEKQALAAQKADKTRIEEIQKLILGLSESTANIAQDTAAKTLDIMLKGYELQIRKMGIEASKTMTALAGASVRGIDIDTKLNIEAIKVEQELTNINRELVIAMEFGRIATEKLTDAYMLTYYKEAEAKARGRNDAEEATRLSNLITGIERKQKTYGPSGTAVDPTTGQVVEGQDMQQRMRDAMKKGGPRAVADLIKETGATAYQTMLPVFLNASVAQTQANLRIAAEKLKGEVQKEAYKVADELKVGESEYRKLTAAMGAFSTGLSSGYSQLLKNISEDVRDRLDIQKITGQIRVQQAIIDSPEATKDAKDKAKAAIDQLKVEEDRLTAEQKLVRTYRDKSTAIQINIDKTRALSDAAQAAIEAQMKNMDQSTAAGMQEAEEKRQESFRKRMAANSQIYQYQTQIIRDTVSQLESELKGLSDEGAISAFMGGEKGKQLGQLKTVLEGQDFIQNIIQGMEKAREAAEKLSAQIRITALRQDELIEKSRGQREIEMQRADLNRQFFADELNRTKSRIGTMASLGLLTDQEIADAERNDQRARIRLELEGRLASFAEQKIRAEEEYQKVLAMERTRLGLANDQMPDSELARLALARKTRTQTMADDASAAARTAGKANEDFLTEQANLSESQKKYAAVFKNSFDSMANAIVEFSKTGKFSFKDFVNSMLQDILRLEAQMLTQSIYKSFMGSFLSNSAGGGSALVSLAKSIFGFANGGYANLGMPIKKYAMGGIIDRPTLFTYANGTNKADMALVGEGKYSEAVVPLPDGKTIPVTMNGRSGEVYVTVNNNTNQQAKVSESKDSRGNRRIEVTVGDMVAGEISRTGSTLQQTFSNTYGIGQMVGRR